jgi:hypothetical protein
MLIKEAEVFQNMKCYANKKVRMTTNTSTELLRVMDPTTVVQGKNNMLFEDKCPTYPQDTLINLCIIHQTSKA